SGGGRLAGAEFSGWSHPPFLSGVPLLALMQQMPISDTVHQWSCSQTGHLNLLLTRLHFTSEPLIGCTPPDRIQARVSGLERRTALFLEEQQVVANHF